MSVQVDVINVKPFVCTYSGIFTPEEIDQINQSIPFEVFVPSMGYDITTDQNSITEYRTSNTFFDDGRLHWVRDRMFNFVLPRFWYLQNYSIECVEQIQCQRYDVGQEYKPHFDYFNTMNQAPITDNDRLATMILYLNDDFQGGATSFDNLGKEYQPKVGSALFFEYNYMPEINIFTYHAGCPVTDGNKKILTLWFRKSPIKSNNIKNI